MAVIGSVSAITDQRALLGKASLGYRTKPTRMPMAAGNSACRPTFMKLRTRITLSVNQRFVFGVIVGGLALEGQLQEWSAEPLPGDAAHRLSQYLEWRLVTSYNG